MKDRKRKRVVVLGFLFILLTVGLYGCGSASKSESAATTMNAYDTAGEVYEESYEETATEDTVADSATGDSGNGQTETVKEDQKDSARKLIKTVSMDVETEEYDALTARLSAKAEELGGYIENSNVSGSSYYNESTRSASFTIRIPKEKLTEFVSLVEEGSNVTNKSESVEDVTLSYVDLESHKEALTTEQDRLLQLLEQAEDMESILAIENRLTEVRYQIQSMESQLRTYDNLIDYATVNLYVSEVVHITAVDKQSAWSEISTGFANSIYQIGRGLRSFGIGLIIRLPYLVIWGIVIGVIVLIVRGIRRRSKKKKALRKQEIEKLREDKNE